MLHDEEDFVYVLSGKMQLYADDLIIDLEQGDAYYLESGVKHKYSNDSNTICAFLDAKSNPLKLLKKKR